MLTVGFEKTPFYQIGVEQGVKGRPTAFKNGHLLLITQEFST